MADNSLQNGTDTIRDKDRAAVKTQIFGVDTNIGGATELLETASALGDAMANPTVPAKGAFLAGWTGSVWERIKSAAGAIFVYFTDVTASGTLTTGQAVTLTLSGHASASFQIPALTGTINFQISNDGGTTWDVANAVASSTSAPATSTTVPGFYRLTPGGVGMLRALLTGTSATVNGRASYGGGGVYANQILPTKNTDGTSSQAIKPASTAAVATDQAAVVALHPSSPLPAGTNNVGTTSNAIATASGSITTQNLVPGGAATAGSAVALTMADSATIAIQVTGTYTGVLSLQVTLDGASWVTVGGTPFVNLNTGAYLATITSALQSVFQAEATGALQARVTALAAVTGTAVVTMRGIAGAHALVALDTSLPTGTNSIGVVDTELPAAAALADGSANPTAPQVGAGGMLFNGTTWDRARGNWATTTGDTGAKTATFNGAAVTNHNARGVAILFSIGTVTGTTPTLSVQVQGSSDGGTTYYNIPGAVTTSITATGQFLLTIYPGVTVAANAAVSFPLPRTWRVVYTIGGTTPSFTLTNVQVGYIL